MSMTVVEVEVILQFGRFTGELIAAAGYIQVGIMVAICIEEYRIDLFAGFVVAKDGVGGFAEGRIFLLEVKGTTLASSDANKKIFESVAIDIGYGDPGSQCRYFVRDEPLTGKIDEAGVLFVFVANLCGVGEID